MLEKLLLHLGLEIDSDRLRCIEKHTEGKFHRAKHLLQMVSKATEPHWASSKLLYIFTYKTSVHFIYDYNNKTQFALPS